MDSGTECGISLTDALDFIPSNIGKISNQLSNESIILFKTYYMLICSSTMSATNFSG